MAKAHCSRALAPFYDLVTSLGKQEVTDDSCLGLKAVIESHGFPILDNHQISEVILRTKEWILTAALKKGRRPERKGSVRAPERDYACQYFNNIKDKVIALYQGIVDVLVVHIGRLPSIQSMKNFINKYCSLYLLDIAEKRFKFHTAYLCCLLTGSPLPVGSLPIGEVPGVIIGGWVRRFFTSSKIEDIRKISLALALQNAKRAALSISQDQQEQFLVDHKENMKGAAYEGAAYQDELGEVREKVRALTEIYYKGHDFSKIRWRTPATSSCFEASREDGGPQSLFRDGDSHLVGTLCESHSDLLPIPVWGADLIEAKNQCLLQLLETSKINATVHKVLEPFKVRVITAGEGLPYQMGRLLQPELHRALRDDPVFRFIGKRHNESDIREMYDGTLLLDHQDYEWLSADQRRGQWTFFNAADFKNATDGMHPSLPRAFIETLALVTNLGPIWRRVLELGLGPHLIHYPDGTVVEQDHGQLMGSPLSFPVLCIVNAAILWASCEEYFNRAMTWREVKILMRPLINGDDINFASNPDHFAVWTRYGKAAGLSPSIGKCYTTNKFVNINSTTYWTELEKRILWDRTYWEVINSNELFVLNPGLIKGQAKVMSDTRRQSQPGDDSFLPYCDQLKEVLRVCPEDKRTLVEGLFFQHLKERLWKTSRSWRLPSWAGGLGLPYGGANFSQMKLAQGIFDRPEMGNPGDVIRSPKFQDQARQLWSAISSENGLEQLKAYVGPKYDVPIHSYDIPSLGLAHFGGTRGKAGDVEGRFKKLLRRMRWTRTQPLQQLQQYCGMTMHTFGMAASLTLVSVC